VRESRQIWNREYDLVYGELIVQGRAVGYYSAALSSDFIFSPGTSAPWKMTLLFGVGMAGVLGVGLLLASSFTRRIRRLVATAEAVTAGNLMARTPVGAGDDELDKLAHCLNHMTDRLEGQYMATMRALASAVAGNNPYTVRHSLRVGELATSLGRHLGVDELTLAQLEIGGYLHDVGKIGIRDTGVMGLDAIALQDRAFVDTHPHIGVEAPDTTSIRNQVTLFIGAGPQGDSSSQAGDDQFAIVGRIVAVADLYDALTADRPDGPPMTSDDALALVRLAAGHLHFATVEALAYVLPEWERSQGRGSDYARLRK
jgi:HD-GYP domain-containing protein (c-di-GMP phosphodiesterase class II)